ncbi:hypothetical protein ABPG75_001767 [Micractinium tetrahymenae]
MEQVRLMEVLMNATLASVVDNLLNLTATRDTAEGGGRAHTWVQIGANTLDSLNTKNDPLLAFVDRVPTWKKFFVEPIPQLYDKLKESVKRWPNSHAVQLAISPNASVAETVAAMYCLEEGFQEQRLGTDLPYWANQLCSFDPTHAMRHFPGKPVRAVNVTAVSVPEMLSRLGLQAVDVLLIDTEGFDAQVVRQIPFDRIRPSLVLWEHKHLHESRHATEEYMRAQCYAVFQVDHENTAGLALPLFGG